MNHRPYWSYSALTQYLRCPLQFFFQRVLGLQPAFTPASLALGSSVHEALAVYHRQMQASEPASDIQKEFLDAWKVRNTLEKIAIEDGRTEAEILAQGIALIEAYLQEPPPEGVLAVEEEMLSPLFNSRGEPLEKPLRTIIDLVATGKDNGLEITDLKTSGRCYSEFEAAVSLQATCYVNAIYSNSGALASFKYVVLIKTRKPRVQQLRTTRSLGDLARLGDLVETIDRAVETGVFYPIESALNCSSCPFRKPCRQWTSDPTSGALMPAGTDYSSPGNQSSAA